MQRAQSCATERSSFNRSFGGNTFDLPVAHCWTESTEVTEADRMSVYLSYVKNSNEQAVESDAPISNGKPPAPVQRVASGSLALSSLPRRTLDASPRPNLLPTWDASDLRAMLRRYFPVLVFGAVILLFYSVFLVGSASSEEVASSSTPFIHPFVLIASDLGDDVSYGIVIDAGSTGSRLFLYSFSSQSAKQLISVRPVKDKNGADVVKKVSPGLSSFAKNPADASDHIMQLLNYAVRFVPYDHQPFTPVFIFRDCRNASFGQEVRRILRSARSSRVFCSTQDSITNSLRSNLPKMTRLQILPEHIQVIDGKWEGIYSWIAVNYVLGRFNFPEGSSSNPNALPSPREDGRSPSNCRPNSNFASDSVNTINLGCSDNDSHYVYNIFVTTFLGFGVNEGGEEVREDVVPAISDHRLLERQPDGRLPNSVREGQLPAQPNDERLVVRERERIPANGQSSSAFLHQFRVVQGTGLWDSCVSEIVTILKNAGDCPSALKCFFAGIQAPPVSLSTMELYGFSEYWYSMHDILALEGKYDHEEFERKARKFCSSDWGEIKSNAQYKSTEAERLQAQCFKSAWIHAVLHDGFHVDELNHKFQSALHIKNQEVPWALGALIYQMRHFPLSSAYHRTTSSYENSSSSFTSHPVLFVFGVILVMGACLLIASRNWAAVSRLVLQRENFPYKKLSQDMYSFRNGQLPV
ncbi:hypothetical protein M3Y99_00879900 [Aphelenchoides fujianensis]|nr:hypothetical protein M3Y99_00879900 [Aphelenchoides fujianensis]